MNYLSAPTKQLYRLMRKELRIPPYTYHRIKDLSLRELDLTLAEINWFLNTVEWNYGVEVGYSDINLDTSVEDFFVQLLEHSVEQSGAYDESFQMMI